MQHTKKLNLEQDYSIKFKIFVYIVMGFVTTLLMYSIFSVDYPIILFFAMLCIVIATYFFL